METEDRRPKLAWVKLDTKVNVGLELVAIYSLSAEAKV